MKDNQIISNSQEITDSSVLIPAPVSNRFFAFLIDVFFVYLIRYFYVAFSLTFWLKKPIQEFLQKYEMLYGKFSFSNITNIEINYFFNSNLFRHIIVFLIGIFLIGVLYNLFFFLTKWSATLGQKFLGMYVSNKDGQKIKVYQATARSILLMIPWAFLFLLMVYKTLAGFEFAEPLDRPSFVVSIFIFLSWYDLAFFTKNKLTFHDYMTSTRVVVKNPEKYLENESSSIWKSLFPSFGDTYESLKDFAKTQFAKAKEMKAKYKEERKKNKK